MNRKKLTIAEQISDMHQKELPFITQKNKMCPVS